MLSTYLVHNILITWQELADDVLLMLLYSYLFLYTWTVQLSVMKTWLIMNYYVYMYYYKTHVICVYCIVIVIDTVKSHYLELGSTVFVDNPKYNVGQLTVLFSLLSGITQIIEFTYLKSLIRSTSRLNCILFKYANTV